MEPTIQLCSGAYFDFRDPSKSQYSLEDIAHALSQINRFTGHTKHPYSVAQHSVAVSLLVSPAMALQALLHDAHEAFVGDVPSPLKMLLPDYRQIERAAEIAVRERFGVPVDMHPSVKRADLVMLATERHWLMPAGEENWSEIEGIAIGKRPGTLTAAAARALFLRRFNVLNREQAGRAGEAG